MGTHTSKVQEIKRGGQTIVAHKGDTLARPRGPTAEETVIDAHLGVYMRPFEDVEKKGS